MKTIIKLILLTFSAAAFFGCTETIELDLDQAPPRVVVDGLITNEDTEHYIRLTRSMGFYQEGKAPGVSGAEVEVTDNAGNIHQFTENETGQYLQPERSVAGRQRKNCFGAYGTGVTHRPPGVGTGRG